jgi:hypothetical protein
MMFSANSYIGIHFVEYRLQKVSSHLCVYFFMDHLTTISGSDGQMECGRKRYRCLICGTILAFCLEGPRKTTQKSIRIACVTKYILIFVRQTQYSVACCLNASLMVNSITNSHPLPKTTVKPWKEQVASQSYFTAGGLSPISSTELLQQ